MCHCRAQVEERRVGIQLEPCANYSDVRVHLGLEGQGVGEVGLVDPATLINDSLSLEATKLQRIVCLVLEHLIRSGSDTSHVFEVLAHQAVATARIRRIHHLHLFDTVTRCVPSLVAEEQFFLTVVAIDVLRAEQ